MSRYQEPKRFEASSICLIVAGVSVILFVVVPSPFGQTIPKDKEAKWKLQALASEAIYICDALVNSPGIGIEARSIDGLVERARLNSPDDPWGNAFRLRLVGESVRAFSAGKDVEIGTEDDLYSDGKCVPK
jgi:hypothetical protein